MLKSAGPKTESAAAAQGRSSPCHQKPRVIEAAQVPPAATGTVLDPAEPQAEINPSNVAEK